MSLPSDARTLVRAVAVFLAGCVALAASPAAAQTTLGDGTNPPPPAQPVCPAPNPPGVAAGTAVDGFTFRSAVNDVINSVRVQLSPTGTYKLIDRIEIRSAVNDALLFGAIQPASDLENIFFSTPINLVANAPEQSFVIKLVPKTHAAMPRPDAGQLLKLTAKVNTFSTTTSRVVNDAASTIVSLDNQSPADVLWDSATAGAASVTLRWKGTPSVIVLRRENGPVLDRPTEGSIYSGGATLPGGARVVYVGAGAMPDDTTVTPGRPYYYTVFAKDDCGNYSPGASVGPIVAGGVGEGDAARPSYRAVVGLLNPLPGTVTSPFRVQVRVFSPKAANGNVQPVGTVELGVDSGSGYVWSELQRNTAYGNATDSGIWEVLPGGRSLAPGSYTIRARATSSASATPVYSAAIGVVVSAVRGDGTLLVRDNSGQLCQDCHKGVQTHSSEVTGTEQGSWYVGCRGCHDPHGATNAALVADEITPPNVRGNYGPSRVYFAGVPGYSATGGASSPSTAGFANGDPGNGAGAPHTGVCQVCHTTTQYWTRTGGVSDHYGDQKCTSCHSHSQGMAASCTGCHGDANRQSIAGADALQTAAPPKAVSGALASSDPAVGEHEAHVNSKRFKAAPLACVECHMGAAHAATPEPGNAQVFFGALATHQKPDASYAPGVGCAVYCHGATLAGGSNASPSWTAGDTIGCATCHGAPPPITMGHPRNTACVSCHGTDYAAANADLSRHIDRTLDVQTSGCTACHGNLSAAAVTLASNVQKAAPGVDAGSVDVAGSTAATKPGVGAHAAHLTGTRLLQGSVACSECHQLPPSDADTGHATGAGTNGARATVRFGTLAKGGAANFAADYVGSNSAGADTTAGTCASTYCHGAGYQDAAYKGSNQTPGWTAGAAAAACGTCHKSPPSSPAHGSVIGTTNCGMCHEGYAYTLAGGGTLGPKHLNGQPEFSAGCTTCHGTDGVNAAPPKAFTASVNAIGAHQSHVNETQMATRSAAYGCDECHLLPSGAHPDSTMNMAWNLSPTTDWQPGFSTCATSYCHGGTPGQAAWGGSARTPNWLSADDSFRACSACHQSPPPVTSGHPNNGTCDSCHPDGASTAGIAAASAAAGQHVDGGTDLDRAGGCTACHGDLTADAVASGDLRAAPGYNANAASLRGATAATAPAVGAHQKHLTGTALRSAPVACDDCHDVPATGDKLHADGVVANGVYADFGWSTFAKGGALALVPAYTGGDSAGANTTAGSCSSTYCHGGKWAAATPATNANYRGSNVTPSWTGGSAAAACGTCHQAPPANTAHSSVTAASGVNCVRCHGGTYDCTVSRIALGTCTVDKNQHIDGTADVATACYSCHGGDIVANAGIQGPTDTANNLKAAPPTDSLGAATGNRVGPHQAHANPNPLQAEGQMDAPVLCSECHGNIGGYTTSHYNGSVQTAAPALGANRSSRNVVTPSITSGNPYTCSNYCHGASFTAAQRGSVSTWSWNTTTVTCASCHKMPPADNVHVSVAATTDAKTCAPCHGTTVDAATGKIIFTSGATLHIDGAKTQTAACNSCHGSATNNAPPKLANAANTNAVGAHQVHVDATKMNMRSAAFACTDCHPSQTLMTHASGAVDFAWSTLAGAGTTYTDTGNGTCASNYCHGSANATPTGATVSQNNWGAGAPPAAANWGNATGTARACTACHGAPPALGTSNPHPPNNACDACHPDGSTTTGMTLATAKNAHVNRTVDVDRTGCTQCHGDLTTNAVASGSAAAAPGYKNGSNVVVGADVNGSTTGNRVGAHWKHLQGLPAGWGVDSGANRVTQLTCNTCHQVPVSGTTHATGVSPTAGARATLSFNTFTGGASATYAVTASVGTCSSTYCHAGTWAADPLTRGTAYNPTWTATGFNCGSCHQSPPSDAPHTGVLNNKNCSQCHGAAYDCVGKTGGVYQSAALGACVVDPANHLNKAVETPGMSCGSCHGSTVARTVSATGVVNATNLPGAPPNDLAGSATSNAVGVHLAHLNPAGATQIYLPLKCSDCHATASDTYALGHAEGTRTVTLANSAGANLGSGAAVTWTAGSPGSCVTYCHGDRLPSGASVTLAAFQGTQTTWSWSPSAPAATCTSCHAFPPDPTGVHAGNTAYTTCVGCHAETVNADATVSTFPTIKFTGTGASAATTHMDGAVTGGISNGGLACTGCHNTIYSAMNSATHRHTMTSAVGPGAAAYPTATNQQACVQCHVDHDKFNATPGANLRNSATAAAPTAASTDHSGTAGVCVSCHGTGTFTKASGGTTPTVNGTTYGGSAHSYAVNSTFTRGGTFSANCSKCHGGSATQFQNSTNKFATHDSNQTALLAPLGATANPLEEQECYRCHSAAGEAGKTVTANDYYGAVTTMRAGATGIYTAMSSVGTSYTTATSSTLYLRNNGTTNAVVPTKPAAYQFSSGTYTTNTFNSRDMAPTSGTTGTTTLVSTGATANRYDRGLQFVSPQVHQAVTIPSGSVFSLTIRENRAAGTSTDYTRFTVYKWNGTTATPFNTSAAPNNYGQSATAIGTTATNRTITLTSNQAVTLNPGDAIVADVEFVHTTGTTALNVTYAYGNFGTDAAALALPAGTYVWRTGATTRPGHGVGSYSGAHKAAETRADIAGAKHTECADCHSPHGAGRGNGSTGGTASAGAANSLTHATAGWTANQWAGYYVRIVSGAGVGQERQISSNTATVLTTAGAAFNPLPSSTSVYQIYARANGGMPTAVSGATLTDGAKAWPGTNIWANWYAYIQSGPGAGQVRRILSNTATALTLESAFSPAPTTASVYRIVKTAADPLTGAAGVDVTTWPAQATTWTTGTLLGATYNPSTTTGALPTATAQWQVCFKCHSGANSNIESTWSTGLPANGTFTDVAREFNPNNQSYHPVVRPLTASTDAGAGSSRLGNVSRLINGWSRGDLMTCTDCHNADAASPAAQGPHGSAIKYMLAGVNRAWPFTTAGATSGTAWTLTATETNLGTSNGLFCRNCHPAMNTAASNALHTAYTAETRADHTSNMQCVKCHIRIPHGGKVSRLLVTTNAPARYQVPGNTPVLDGASKPTTADATMTAANINDATAPCGQHNGGSTEAW